MYLCVQVYTRTCWASSLWAGSPLLLCGAPALPWSPFSGLGFSGHPTLLGVPNSLGLHLHGTLSSEPPTASGVPVRTSLPFWLPPTWSPMILGLPDSLGLPLHRLGFSGTPTFMEASPFLEPLLRGGSTCEPPAHSEVHRLSCSQPLRALHLWSSQLSGGLQQSWATPTLYKALLCEPRTFDCLPMPSDVLLFLVSPSPGSPHTLPLCESLPLHSLCLSLPFGFGLIILRTSMVWASPTNLPCPSLGLRFEPCHQV